MRSKTLAGSLGCNNVKTVVTSNKSRLNGAVVEVEHIRFFCLDRDGGHFFRSKYQVS